MNEYSRKGFIDGIACRLPTVAERDACLTFVKNAESPEKGLQGVLWSLVNTREFLLQH